VATQLIRDDLPEILAESGGDLEFEALVRRELELLGEDPDR
jgi:hypothetical protein